MDGMIDITAAVGGQGHFLAHRRQETPVPACTGEGALRILPLDTRDSEAVALKFAPPAGDAVDEEAGVDRWKRDRDLLLDIVDSKPFERPAGNANVGMRIDSLGVDEVAKQVVAGDFVV